MPQSKNLSFDDNTSNDSLLERFRKSAKTTANKSKGIFSRLYDNIATFVASVSSTTKDLIEKPHQCLSFAYFTIDSKTSKIRFNPLSTIFSRWFTILTTYFKQIGFGNQLVGFLISASLLPATILAVTAFVGLFWLIVIPQLLLAPLTLGISLITLIGSLILYAFVLMVVVVIFVSLWIGLIAALLGVGFVYGDDACADDDSSDSDSDDCTTTTKYSCGTTTTKCPRTTKCPTTTTTSGCGCDTTPATTSGCGCDTTPATTVDDCQPSESDNCDPEPATTVMDCTTTSTSTTTTTTEPVTTQPTTTQATTTSTTPNPDT